MPRRYLPPALLAQIPAGLVPIRRMGELVDGVVAALSPILESGGAIHPALIRNAAIEVAAKLGETRDPALSPPEAAANAPERPKPQQIELPGNKDDG